MKIVISFLLIFSLIVIIHEFGHYYFAKRAGIKVREFAIGMGPKLFSMQAGADQTTYTLRALPLGGYVRLAGLAEEDDLQAGMEVGLKLNEAGEVERINKSSQPMDDDTSMRVDSLDLLDNMTITGLLPGNDDFETFEVSKRGMLIEEDGTAIPIAPRETRYEAASPLQKFMTNIAGPMNNFILSIILFTLVAFLLPGVPEMSTTSELGQILPDSPAEAAGLKEGDQVTEINHTAVSTWEEMVEEIKALPEQKVDLTIKREEETLTLPLTVGTRENEDTQQAEGQIGVMPAVTYDSSLVARLKYGFTETWSIIVLVISTLAHMVKNGFSLNDFGGPIAIAQMTSDVVHYGLLAVIRFAAYISANLGIFNLLPIPALDGGKLVLNVIEGIRGKPLDESVEGVINLIGVGLLVLLFLAVTWNDIQRLFY